MKKQGILLFCCCLLWSANTVLAKGNLKKLIQQIKSKSYDVRVKAEKALVKMGSKAYPAIPILMKEFKKAENEDINESIILVFRKMGDAVIPYLKKGLKNRHWRVRRQSCYTLGQIRTRKAVKVLISATKHRDRQVRRHAIEALGNVGPKAAPAVPALIKALQDRKKIVRENAAYALGQIGSKATAAIPTLMKWLRSKNESRRSLGIETIGKIGVKQKRYRKLLQRYLKDPSALVRKSVKKILHPKKEKGLVIKTYVVKKKRIRVK